MLFYIIKSIAPKDGVMREIHKEAIGRKCSIMSLEVGQRGWIKFEPSYDPGCFHRLHTSAVLKCTKAEDESWVEIETLYTTYRLERLEETN